MKRKAMKLDYDILKIGLDSYLAITSNTFQFGAHLDLKIAWKAFGISFGLFGKAGFDTLFQFDPFMFMFDAECSVSAKCGSKELMSIYLAFSLSGPRPWHASGKAKFYLLGFSVDVDFSLEWGDKHPKLPNKQIELKPIIEKQILNYNNWTISEKAQTDDDVVVSMEHEEDELLIQPFGAIHFNQSAIPLQLKQPMDLCNNAVPTDYNNITVTGFTISGKQTIQKTDDDNLTNDFAPALYYNLNPQEKLETPSYKKYVSGFSLSASEGIEGGTPSSKTISKTIFKKGAEEPEKITANITASRTKKSKVAPVTKGKKDTRKTSYPLKTRNAFDRYIKTLDAIND